LIGESFKSQEDEQRVERERERERMMCGSETPLLSGRKEEKEGPFSRNFNLWTSLNYFSQKMF